VATARRTARSTSASLFAIKHAAGRPATAPAFLGEKLSAILKARAIGGGERDRPAGTSEHTDRACDLLRRERECFCRNGSDLLRKESEWCRKERQRRAITTCVSDVRKKATLGGNQKR
jgi:hypothetical protein